MQELDEIGDASQIEAPARQRQRHHPADGATFAIGGVMRNIVQDPSLGREAVLLPLPLDMDQGGLTQAINRVLQRRERNRIVEFLHDDLPLCKKPRSGSVFRLAT